MSSSITTCTKSLSALAYPESGSNEICHTCSVKRGLNPLPDNTAF